MKTGWVLLTAYRYLLTRRKEKGHVAFGLSVAGLAVGVMTLITVLSVMNGFQQGFISNLNEISSYHIRIESETADMDPELMESILETDGVESVVAFSDSQAVLQAEFSSPQGGFIRALQPEAYDTDEGFRERIRLTDGAFDLSGSGGIILGNELARSLRLLVGDSLTVIALVDSGGGRMAPRSYVFEVRGIVKSGYYEIDRTFAFISLEDGRGLLGHDPFFYGIKVDRHFRDHHYSRLLESQLGVNGDQITSWRDYNKSFFSALLLEKIMMMMVVGLVFVVVAVNLFQALKRSVVERLDELALLKAVGARPFQIRSVFIWEGLIISLLGGLSGLGVGLLVSWQINGIFRVIEITVNKILGLIRFVFPQSGGEFSLYSSSYFYLTKVPVVIMTSDILWIIGAALLSSVLAALLASKRIAVIKPAEVLRYE